MYQLNNLSSTSSTNMATTGGNYTEPVPDVSFIARGMGTVQKLLAEHREIQGVIEQRLHSVLNPAAPTMNGTGNQQKSASSPMASDLDDFTNSLQQLLLGYQNILNRLEL